MADYPETDVYEHATVRVRLRHGRFGAKDAIVITRDGKEIDRGFKAPSAFSGTPNPQRVAEVAAYLRALDDAAAVWVLCPRTGVLCQVPDDHPAAKKRKAVHSLCCTIVSTDQGRWTDFSVCGRLVLDPARPYCNVHAGVLKRREAKAAQDQLDAAAREQRLDQDQAISAEVKELWAAWCDMHDVDPERRGRPTANARTATVDSELLRLILRQAVDL